MITDMCPFHYFIMQVFIAHNACREP